MENLQRMTKDELLAELHRLEDCLSDLAEEKALFFQTTLHMGRRYIEERRQEWAADEQRYQERITAITVILETNP